MQVLSGRQTARPLRQGGLRVIVQVILHIGAHRTGTTTLQRFLQANQGLLAGQGIAVWGPEKTREGLFSGLIKNPDRLTPEDERRAQRSGGVIAIELQRAAEAGMHTVIVTEENMMGAMPNNIYARRLYPHAHERLSRMAAAFGDAPTRVVMGIRSYDRHWASQLGFFVKQGFGLPDPAALSELAAQPIRWMRVIRQMAAAFPRTTRIVWPFEGLVGLPEAQLAALLGYPLPGPFAALRDWHNATPNCADLHAALIAQDAPATALARIGSSAARWQPFTDAETAAMRAAYAQDLAWLRAGADGLAHYIDSPDTLSGMTGPGRGYHDDERQSGMG